MQHSQEDSRAIEFSIFPSPPWVFAPSPLAGEGWDGGRSREREKTDKR